MRTGNALPPTDEAGIASRGVFWIVALAYTVFVIYGSLVPLDYHAIPLDEALSRFRQIPFLRLGIASRADWVANLLLFIPLTFLWMGALVQGRGAAASIVASLAMVVCAMMLSATIEFTQLYFPQRTVSLNDLIAETLGGLIGIAAWWLGGENFARWLSCWRTARTHLEIAQRVTLVYLALLFGYSLLPLDLTISLVEVFHKFREGKLNLIPFARLPDEPALAVYELASDALLWFVPALLWRLSGKASALRVWAGMTGAAVLLEILQLFVYSRVSDVTDVFTAALGAAVGVWVARFTGNKIAAAVSDDLPSQPALSTAFSMAIPLILAAIWAFGILAVFWFPFDFRGDGAFLRGRLHDLLSSAPFEAYYFGTEYRAATEVMHKVLFFIPLGMLLGWFVTRLKWRWRSWGAAAALIAMAGAALLVLAGRLAQPDKHPDIMDPILQWMGGALGYVLFRITASHWRRNQGRPIARRSASAHARSGSSPRNVP